MNNIINIKRILPILLVLVAFFSCEEKFQVLDSSSYFVRFGQASVDVLEGNSVIKIPVTLAGPKQGSPVTISYEVSGTATKAQDFSFASTEGSLSIPAGSFADTIRINVLDDFETDGLKTIVLNLKTASNGLKAGLGTLGNKLTVNIADNDCPFDIDNYVGSYDVEIISEAAFGNPSGSYLAETSLTKGATANTLIDENFWDFGPNSVIITLDPSNSSNLVAKLVGPPQRVYLNAASLARFAIQGTQPFGSFNTCQKSITVNMELTRQDGVTVANRSVIKYRKK